MKKKSIVNENQFLVVWMYIKPVTSNNKTNKKTPPQKQYKKNKTVKIKTGHNQNKPNKSQSIPAYQQNKRKNGQRKKVTS